MLVPDGGHNHSEVDFWLGVCRQTEEWWGEALGDKMYNTIYYAPSQHIELYCESIRETAIPGKAITPVPSGHIRPFVTFGDAAPTVYKLKEQRAVALRVLLYSHEVVLQSDFFDKLILEPQKFLSKVSRINLLQGLEHLRLLKPFLSTGSVHFIPTYTYGHYLHQANTDSMTSVIEDPAVHDIAVELASTMRLTNTGKAGLVEALAWHFGALSVSCALAERRYATPLARSEAEKAILAALLEKPVVDGRATIVSSLARLPVPDFSGDPALLARLRNDEESFSTFRERLAGALAHVEQMTDLSDLNEAAQVVHSELSFAITAVTKSVERSPALQALKGGLTRFGIAAVAAGTAGGLAAGGPWAGLAGAAAGQTVDAVRSYVEAINSRRRGRLILDVCTSFGE
ncbi:hypothetical protein [Mycobacterium sp.]|uniref:hypothetical protein n=1 Tax=Mycobacterium sp. TaxID=1785 RepID=UPI001207A009|nr:hypothetical protein [Mycobacterium sp.]TAM64109.1 MAG: hypothetical protein EPN51_24945 [Mycobacterium sp.]